MEAEAVQAAPEEEGNIMKLKNYYYGFIFLISGLLLLPGCYTTVWSPEQDIPETVDNSDSFYPQDYYGDYNNYYNTPWWVSIDNPGVQVGMPVGSSSSASDSSETQTFIRNLDGGRSSSGFRDAILDLVAPARVISSGSGASRNTSSNNNNSSTTNNTNSNNSTYAPVRTERAQNSNTNSNNSTTQSRTSSSSRSTNNNTRNNDGGRKTDGGR